MPDHDLQFGIPIEYPAQDHANDMNPGLDVPAPAGIGRLLRRCDRQGGKSGKPLRILLYGLDEEIVRLAGDRDLLRHVSLFDPGRIQR